MTEEATVAIQAPEAANGTNGPLLESLRQLLALPKKERREQIKGLSFPEREELRDILRDSPSDMEDEDKDDGFADTYFQEVVADLKWMHEQYNAGAFNDVLGQYVAVAFKQRLGSGPFPDVLTDEVAARTGLPEERILIEYVDDGSWWR